MSGPGGTGLRAPMSRRGGRSIPNALHSELTQTDPDGRINGMWAPARRAKTRGVVHDRGRRITAARANLLDVGRSAARK